MIQRQVGSDPWRARVHQALAFTERAIQIVVAVLTDAETSCNGRIDHRAFSDVVVTSFHALVPRSQRYCEDCRWPG